MDEDPREAESFRGAAAGASLVGRLADEFVARRSRGEDPDLEEYLARAPEHAAELRQAIDMALLLVKLGSSEELADGTERASAVGGPAAPPLVELGGYQIVREIGRGGMGIVYEAEQPGLGRRVALKVLPLRGLRDGRNLDRFRNEILAAARLQHEHIVPVFEGGEAGDFAYYAMHLVRGQSLDEVLKEVRRRRGPSSALPEAPSAESMPGMPLSPATERLLGGWLEDMRAGEPPRSETAEQGHDPAGELAALGSEPGGSDGSRVYSRSVARIGLRIAEALAYAHAEGVIHRDIKPSNILLDGSGKVWLTDFGLAKLEGTHLTQSGDVLGTLQYMPPERFRGWSDARGDIYALGATLYEMLALRPPFVASDRARLIERISSSSPPPLRRLDAAIPLDLETIILKTLEKEPAERYASAADLAGDLRRFLDDRPVLARRSTVIEQGWRWVKRNRAAAALAAGLLVALVAGLVATTWQWLRLDRMAEERRFRLYNAEIAAAQIAWEEGNSARARALLERQRPAPGQGDPRGFEWRHLWRLCHGEKEVFRLPFRARSVGFPGDGSAPLVIGAAGAGKRGQELWVGRGDWTAAIRSPEPIEHPRASPDGKRVGGIAGGAICIWEARSGGLLQSLAEPGIRGPMVFSDDGRWLAAHANDSIVVWSLESGEVLRRLEATGTGPLAFSAAGSLLAAGAGSTLRVWDLRSGRVAAAIELPFRVAEVALSPDGKLAALASVDRLKEMRDLETGASVAALEHLGSRCLRFSADGKHLVSGSWDHTVRIFEATGGRVLATFRGHESKVIDAAFVPGGGAVISACEDSLRVWDLGSPESSDLLDTGLVLQTTTLAFSPDGRLLLAASFSSGPQRRPGGPVMLWEVASGRRLEAFEWDAEPLTAAAFSEDGGAVVLGGSAGTLRRRDLGSGVETPIGAGLGGAVRFLEFTPDGRRLVAATPSAIRVLDAQTGEALRTFEATRLGHADVAPDGAAVAFASENGLLAVLEIGSGKLRFERSDPSVPVFTAAFSPDSGLLASAHGDASVRVWDARTGALRGTLRGHAGMAISVAFSPDGTTLASGGVMGKIKLWDPETLDERLTLYLETPIRRLQFSPDGSVLAAGAQSQLQVRLWRAAPGGGGE
jgi:serine/threonine protein kinase/WD40 repeat protein